MIDGLKRYEGMRDSGVGWMKQMPAHWKVLRGKFLFRCVDLRSDTGKEELLTVSSKLGVVLRSSATVTMFKAESYVGYKLCWPRDLVINSLWAWAGGLGVSRYHGIISSAYGVYRLRDPCRIHPDYIHRLVRSTPFNFELRARSKGIWTSRLQLTDEAFLDAPFPVPPIDEQTAIVRFLSHADRRIRRYIRAKQKLIALLEEQKQAIIHQAVTCGVDPNTPLKPTGNSWFPKVPAHWDLIPLRRVITRSVDGPHHSPDYVDQGIPFLSTRNIKVDRWSLEDVKFISPSDYETFCQRVKPEIGDVLYTKGGTTGVARAVDLDYPFQVWVHVAVLKLKKSRVLPRYLAATLNTPRCYEQSQLFTRGATNQDLGLGRMKDILLPIPPLSVQSVIIERIVEIEGRIERRIQTALREIALLREYRTRLISDVVTGKLDVREAAVALPEVDHLAAEDSLDDSVDTDAEPDLDATLEEAEA